MKRKVLILYMCSVLFSFGAINASSEGECYKYLDGRQVSAEGCIFALIPVANLLIAVFGTGFMEYGWTLHIPSKGEHPCRS
jgi:hypothetical protein